MVDPYTIFLSFYEHTIIKILMKTKTMKKIKINKWKTHTQGNIIYK